MSAFNDRISERRRTFKNTGDGVDARRRREDEALQIRKREKEEQMSRRRKLVELSSDIPGNRICLNNVSISTENIPKFAACLNDQDPLVVAEATIALRKILSVDRNPPIAEVLNAGVLPRLKELLADKTRPNIQLEACWALTNIASGSPDQTQAVVESGVVPLFVELLASCDSTLQEQAVWAVANIAGDRTEYRDGCISAGTAEALTHIVTSSIGTSLQMTRLAVWGLSNLCRGKPGPDFTRIKTAVPPLARALAESNDTEVLADASWAFSYLTDSASHNHILLVLDHLDLRRVAALLAHPSGTVHTPILRVVGNLVSGESDVTHRVVSTANCLTQLKSLMLSNKKAIRKETLWTISNICADSQTLIQAVIDAGIMARLCELVKSGNCDMDVKKEGIWCICNSVTVGSKAQIDSMVVDSRFDILSILSDFLETARDTRSVRTALEAIYAVLLNDQGGTRYTSILEEVGGLTNIENLQQDESEEIYQACVRILENFFHCDEQQSSVEQKENIIFDFGARTSSLSG